MHTPHPRAAFTVVELLIVVAVIVALCLVLLPGIGLARDAAARAACAGNLRQLAIGWRAYADDNRGRIASADTDRSLTYNAWVDYSYATDTISQAGVLVPYLERSLKLYNCPAPGNPNTVLTYVANSAMDCGRDRTWTGLASSCFVRSLLQVANPASLLLFTEEYDPRRSTTSRNGFLQNTPVLAPWNAPQMPYPGYAAYRSDLLWGDFPGGWHKRGVNIAWADGHVAFRPFAEARTATLVETTGAYCYADGSDGAGRPGPDLLFFKVACWAHLVAAPPP